MTTSALAAGEVSFAAYVLVFGLAALVSLGAVGRARRIADPDTRRGLTALLVMSGAWAAAHVGFLVAPSPQLKVAFYQAGLVVGVATVGPWLYFASAFTGRTLHRSAILQRVAGSVFLAIVAVKLTNPLHHLYFRTEFVTVPFPHLAVESQLLHWLVMGLAYALATVGYFMLFELFWQVGHDTRPFAALVGLTGLPVVFDVVGYASPWLLDFTYEPLGVAAFAVGVLFVYLENFQTIQLAGEHDDPVIVLDDANRVRDFNAEAERLFSGIEIGTEIDAVVPEIAEVIEAEEAIIEIERRGGIQYFQTDIHPFSTDGTRIGQAVTLSEVTERERYRSELERQNERLEQFASMVSHDLRNPLNVAQGHIDLARETGDSEELSMANTALDRMETLIEDMLALARQGQPISETEPVDLSTVVDRSWSLVATGEAALTIEDDRSFQADPDRLQQLLENLFRNAVEHGGDGVAVRVGALDDGFFVADDGPGIPEDERDAVFESGYSTDEDGTGFGLAIIEEIVQAHGWSITVVESRSGGARFEVRGVSQ
ncbi:MAG: ATP-binding protein [Halobacteriales archaeon]